MTESVAVAPQVSTDRVYRASMASGEERHEVDSSDGDHDRLWADVIAFPSVSHPSKAPAADPPLRTVVGDVLRDERRRQGRTLADVAGAAAVSLSYLSEIERGRKEVSSDLLDAVSGALDLTLVHVLERCVERLRGRAQGGGGIQLRAA